MRKQDFKRLSDYVWEIPADYRADMQVPARLYASEPLLEAALEDRSVEQLINTATLPGLVGAAMAMPDIHQGYGFPIGGVVASRTQDGMISPGGVGYDINCLHGGTQVLHAPGYTRSIREMAGDWDQSSLVCQDFESQRETTTFIARYISIPPASPVYQVKTESGDVVTATADHPFWTPDGMVELDRLQPSDQIAMKPFQGVPYQFPGDQILVDERDIERMMSKYGKGKAGNALGRILKYLNQRELLPLQADSPQLPYLLKIAGFVWGDGGIYFIGRAGKGVTWFFGKPGDLETIRQDVLAAGFTPSRVYTRIRHHQVTTTYKDYEFTHHESAFKVSSSAFAVLLAALGVPVGNKASQSFRLPAWIKEIPAWQQRLFLAALFGAELTAPDAYEKHNHNFKMPGLSVNKREEYVESGREFLEDIAVLLDNCGVVTSKIAVRSEQINQDGTQSCRLRLCLSATLENLINLWGRVGFEYNADKSHLAHLATQYLKNKREVLRAREAVAQAVSVLREEGMSVSDIHQRLNSYHTHAGFIEHSLYRDPQRQARVGQRFQSFEDYCQEATAGLGDSGMVWERIASIEPADDVDLVYDFTVAHPDHNFVANGFVVSNCGVRALASNLDLEEVRPYIDQLASTLYRNCPSGVGKGGGLTLNNKQFEEVLIRGSEWALDEGYAEKQDVLRTEENGHLTAADPEQVSKNAWKRGIGQIGTLGAGNHFIEVDVIDEVFDEEAAAAMGLVKGRIAVQIHCGSRGFGHQVCSDYVRSFQSAIHKYNISIPDRELIYAPFNSPEGQAYYGAMCAAANFAFVNRQVLASLIRRSFEEVLQGQVSDWHLHQVYDIAHNMAKVEEHTVDGKAVEVAVHRKGATRAFGPGFEGLPPEYRPIGQPVLVPGSMGTSSWVLVGTAASMEQTFGSSCHGAGRTMSRSAAKRSIRGDQLRIELKNEGIHIRAGSMPGLAEEAPQAYKDVDEVIKVVSGAGIARKVARLVPVAVIKG
ncbi:MAG: RtcB family protein [Anaerolineae bacterium]|nr:RtcB family protein [Anaerolineae bacterium]